MQKAGSVRSVDVRLCACYITLKSAWRPMPSDGLLIPVFSAAAPPPPSGMFFSGRSASHSLFMWPLPQLLKRRLDSRSLAYASPPCSM